MINNAVIVSGEQQRDSATHTHVCILPKLPSHQKLLLWTKDDTGGRIKGAAGKLAVRGQVFKGVESGRKSVRVVGIQK